MVVEGQCLGKQDRQKVSGDRMAVPPVASAMWSLNRRISEDSAHQADTRLLRPQTNKSSQKNKYPNSNTPNSKNSVLH